MDLQHLRSFAAIAETRSVTRAAARLHFSPSTVSHHLHQLETSVRTSLVELSPLPVTLTPAGRRLLPFAQTIVRLVDEAHKEVVSGALVQDGPARKPASKVCHEPSVPSQRSAAGSPAATPWAGPILPPHPRRPS